MIKLVKGPKPKVLADNETPWRDTYVGHVRDGAAITPADKTRYRHGDIKAALRKETSDKCAYCESKVTHVYPGDCEHMIAKSHRPDLVVTWENLTFACNRCNGSKGEYFSLDEPLIDPYADDPSAHLVFIGPLIFQRPGSGKGERTRLRLKLHRQELNERRRERLDALQPLVERWKTMPESELKKLLQSELCAEAAPGAEYSAMVTTFLREYAALTC